MTWRALKQVLANGLRIIRRDSVLTAAADCIETVSQTSQIVKLDYGLEAAVEGIGADKQIHISSATAGHKICVECNQHVNLHSYKL